MEKTCSPAARRVGQPRVDTVFPKEIVQGTLGFMKKKKKKKHQSGEPCCVKQIFWALRRLPPADLDALKAALTVGLGRVWLQVNVSEPYKHVVSVV